MGAKAPSSSFGPDQGAAKQPRPSGSLIALVLLARVQGIAADAAQLQHQFFASDSVDETTQLIRAAKHIGLHARQVTITFDQLKNAPLPAIAQFNDGEYFIVGKADAERVLIQHPVKGAPETLSRGDMAARWSGTVVFITKRTLMPDALREFNFGWFVDALKKYKGLLYEILLASLFIQHLCVDYTAVFSGGDRQDLITPQFISAGCVGLWFTARLSVNKAPN